MKTLIIFEIDRIETLIAEVEAIGINPDYLWMMIERYIIILEG